VLSRRANWNASLNRLTTARHELWAAGRQFLDLTISNPTRAGIDYPEDELQRALGGAARAKYDPEPLGLRSAREAVAASLGCDAGEIVITASTSEAYSFLFKLLADPGDEVFTAAPAYPLLEHLAQLESVQLRHFPLEYHRRWEMTAPEISERTRAIAVVSPNNPTGSYVREDELRMLARSGVPLVVDEVFREYPLRGEVPRSAASDDVLTFALGGLSKSAGLPHFKLAWIRVSGPGHQKAIEALEMIADNFLSAATPVQEALPDLLAIGAKIRGRILERIRRNFAHLQTTALEALPIEGGWSAVLRVPRVQTDEELALDLIMRQSVIVQPGYFFDFPTDGYLVISLLTPPDPFAEGVSRIERTLAARS
jgi:alanine-synthesizing transaminase